MPVALDTLMLEFEANFSKFDQAANEAERKAVSSAKRIENAYNSVRLPQLKDLKVPVDLKPLHDLNKLLDVKVTHHTKVQGHFNRNPLTVRVNTQQIEQSMAKVNQLHASIQSLQRTAHVVARNEIKATFRHVVDGSEIRQAAREMRVAHKDGATELEKSITRAFKQQKPFSGGLLQGIGGLPFAAGRAVFQGTFEAVGHRITRGISKTTEKTLEDFGGRLDKQINRAAQSLTIALSKAGGYKSSRDFRKDVGQTIDNLTNFSPRRVSAALKKLEDNLVDVLESYAVGDTKAAQAKMRRYAETMLEQPMQAGRNVAGAAIRVGAQPFRIRKRAELAVTIKEAESMVDDIVAQMSAELKAQIKAAKGVTIATGGINYEKGAENTFFSANLVRKLTPGNVTIPVPNTFSNDPSTLGGLYGLRQRFFPSKPQPLDRLLQTSVEMGRNPDAARMLAQIMAVRRVAANKPITVTGSSGGSALVEEVIGAVERAGIGQVKGIGLTLPGFDLTRTASKRNYQTLVGTYDPLSVASFGSRFDDGSALFQRTLKGIPFNTRGLLSPGGATTHFPGIGTGHHLADFLSNPNVQARFSSFAGTGQINPGYTGDRKNFAFANELSKEVQALDRTFGVILGDIKALTATAKGEYSFIDPAHPDWRRDNDFAAMSGNFSKLKVTGADADEYQKFLSFLDRFKAELTSFYETGSEARMMPRGLVNLAREGQSFTQFRSWSYQPEYSAPVPEPTAIEKTQQAITKVSRSFIELKDAAFELENQLTFGLAKKYRQFLGNIGGQTLQMAGTYAQITARDRLLPGIQGFARERLLPAAQNTMGALAGGYNLLQGAERTAFRLLPPGVGPVAKGLLQAGAGYTAINTLAPGVGGMIAGAGSGMGGALATQLGQSITTGLVSQSQAFVVPIATALGNGVSSALSGTWLGQSLAAQITPLLEVNAPLMVQSFTETVGANITGLLAGAGAGIGSAITTTLAGGAAANLVNKAFPQLPPRQALPPALPYGGAFNAVPNRGLNLLQAADERIQYTREMLKLSGAGLLISDLKGRASGIPTATPEDINKLKTVLLIIDRITNALDDTREAQNRVFQEFPGQWEDQFQRLLSNKGNAGKTRVQALGALKEYAPSIKAAAEAGDQTAQGFILSVQRSFKDIEKTAKGTAQQYILTIKRELGIQSPSKVMIRIGQQVVEGFEVGLQDLDSIDDILKRIFRSSGQSVAPGRIDQYTQSIREQVLNGVQDIDIDLDDTLGKNLGKGVKGAADTATPIIGNAIDGLGNVIMQRLRFIAPEVTDFIEGLGLKFDELKSLGVAGLAVGAGFLGATMFGPQILNAINSTADLANEQNRFKRVLNQTVAIGGDRYYAKLADQANRYGVNLQLALRAGASLETSLINTSLSGRGVNLLRGFQAQFAAQGTSTEDQERAQRGFEQVIRKRKLQAEELYQIIEPLPGAMEALAAATGKTTAELFRATQQGEIYAEDFVEKFSRQLEIQSGLVGGADTPEASMQRMQNMQAIFGANVGQMTTVARKGFTDAVSGGLKIFNENAELTNTIVSTLTLSVGVGLVSSLGIAVTSFAKTTMGAMLLARAATVAQLSLGAMGKALVPIAALVLTIQAVRFAWDMSQPTQQMADLEERTRKLKAAIDTLNQPNPPSAGGKNRFEIERNRLAREREEKTRLDPLLGGFSPLLGPLASVPTLFQDADYFLKINKTFEEQQKQINDTKSIDRQIADFNSMNASGRRAIQNLDPRELEKIKRLQEEIATLQGRRVTATVSGDEAQRNKIIEDTVKRQKELNKLLETTRIDGYTAAYTNQLTIIEKNIAAIRENDVLTPAQIRQLQELEKAKANTQEILRTLRETNGVSLAPIQQSNARAINQMLGSDSLQSARERADRQRAALALQQFGGTGTANAGNLSVVQGRNRILQLQGVQQNLNEKIIILEREIKQSIGSVDARATNRLRQVLADLGTTIETATADQLDEAIRRFEVSQEPFPETLKELINQQLKPRRELQRQAQDNRTELLQSQQDLKRSELDKHNALIQYQRTVRDGNENLARAVADNQRMLQRAYEDAILETQRMQQEALSLSRNNAIRSRVMATAGDFTDQFVTTLETFLDQVNAAVNAKFEGAGAVQGIERKIEDLRLQQQDNLRNQRGIRENLNDANADFSGTPMRMSGLGVLAPGTLLGISGNTGTSTGPHLDLRYSRAFSPTRPRPTEEHMRRFLVDGKPLSSFGITSEHASRNPRRPGHGGVDFGTPVGGKITATVPVVYRSQPKWDPNGGGYYTVVRFADGVEIVLLHQDKSVVAALGNKPVIGGNPVKPGGNIPPLATAPQQLNTAAQRVMASFYGKNDGFAGRRTANGEIFDPNAMTAASPTLPFGTMLRVTNPTTGQATVVRINDRGPFAFDRNGKALRPLQEHPERKLDLSAAAAKAIGLDRAGVGPVMIQILNGAGGNGKIPPALARYIPGGMPAMSGNEDAVIGEFNQQSALQQDIARLRQQSSLIQASKTYRDAMRMLEDQISSSQVSAINRRNDIAQRRLSNRPPSPILDAIGQFNQQVFGDQARIVEQERANTKLREDIAAMKRLQQETAAKSLDRNTPAEQVQQFENLLQTLKQVTAEREKQLALEEDYLKVLREGGLNAKLYRDLRTAMDSRMQSMESALAQVEQIQTTLDLFGNAPAGVASRGVGAQFRGARLQMDLQSDKILSETERQQLTGIISNMSKAGRTQEAAVLQKMLSDQERMAGLLEGAAKQLSPEAEAIARSVAELQESYQRMLNSRKFEDMLSEATSNNLGLRARIMAGRGNTLGANALNRQVEVLRIEREFSDKILSNNNEISQLRAKAANDPAANAQIATLDQVNERLKEQRELALELASQTYPTLAEQMNATIGQATGGVFTDLVNGIRQGKTLLESLGDAFQRFADRLLDKLLEFGEGGITSGITGLLSTIFNPNRSPGLGSLAANVASFGLWNSSGGAASVAAGALWGFSRGGTVVGNLAGGGTAELGMSAMMALKRERQMNGGRGVGLYALTDGEEVLNPREAAFFRAVRANGIWDDLKANLGYTSVKNRAEGGTVGNYAQTVNQVSNDRSRGSTISVSMPLQPANKSDEDILRRILPELQTQFQQAITERLFYEKKAGNI